MAGSSEPAAQPGLDWADVDSYIPMRGAWTWRLKRDCELLCACRKGETGAGSVPGLMTWSLPIGMANGRYAQVGQVGEAGLALTFSGRSNVWTECYVQKQRYTLPGRGNDVV